MTEVTRKLAILNGKFIIIDAAGTDTSVVVCIYPSDKKTRNQEIDFISDLFSSNSEGKLTAGDTTFLLSKIRRQNSCNDPVLEDHAEPTKMVVVKNEETDEFFLVMSADTSIFAARKFLQEINQELFHNNNSPLAKITGERYLFFLYASTSLGSLKFEVATNLDIVIVKLNSYS